MFVVINDLRDWNQRAVVRHSAFILFCIGVHGHRALHAHSAHVAMR